MKQKMIKFGRIRIKFFESPNFSIMQLNFGRYKKGRKIDTWTLYDAISEKYKPMHDEIWPQSLYQDFRMTDGSVIK